MPALREARVPLLCIEDLAERSSEGGEAEEDLEDWPDSEESVVDEDWQAFQDWSKEISAMLQEPSEDCNWVGHREVTRLIKERQRAAMRCFLSLCYVAKRLHEMDGAQVFSVCFKSEQI